MSTDERIDGRGTADSLSSPKPRPGHSIAYELRRLILLAVLPFVALTGALAYFGYQDARRNAEGFVRRESVRVFLDVAKFLGETERGLARIAGRMTANPVSGMPCDPWLADLVAIQPRFLNVNVIDHDGWVICGATPPAGGSRSINIADREWFRAVASGQRFALGMPRKGPILGRWNATAAVPILGPGGAFAGAVSAAIDLAGWEPNSSKAVIPEESVLGVINGAGVIVMRFPDANEWIGRGSHDSAIFREMLRVRDGVFEAPGLVGIPRIWSVSPIPGTDWLAYAGIRTSTIMGPPLKETAVAVATAVFAIMIATWLALLASRRLGRPMAQIARAARARISGSDDLVPVTGPTELAEVGEELNRMILAQKEAHAALQANSNLLRIAGGLARIGGWHVNLAEGRVLWSDEVAAIHEMPPGYSPMLDEGINYYAPEWRDRITEAFGACARDGTPYDEEMEIITARGRRVWVRAIGEAIRDQAGKIISVQGAFQDITERKQTELELIESERQYRALFENMTAGFVLFEVVQDDRGVPVDLLVIAANKGFEATTGLKLEEVTGRRLTQVLPGIEDDAADWIGTYGKVALTGEGRQIEQYSEHLGIHYAVTAWQARAKQCAVTFVDITERKKAEKEKAVLEAQFQQAQKMDSVGRLAGGVAHDFNNMLTVIRGNVALAIEQVDPAQPIHSDLVEIQKAADRSADLTRQLLAFARKQVVEPRVLDLNQTISGILKMLQRLIGEDIGLEWHPGEDLWAVRIDPSQIDQILANLCINARDAISGVGNIAVETENNVFDEDYCAAHSGFVPGEYVRISVSDTGRGMDKETLEHIFEPFFTTKRAGEGTGLGLATVFGAVKQNNGFINVYSEPDTGTTFTIYLPRHAGAAEQDRAEQPERPLRLNQGTILLVEDEPSILKLTERILARQGYAVLSARRPGEAIRLAGEHAGTIHLLMTDVVMPEMNGRDLANHLQSRYAGLKVLFMSGYTANIIVHQGVLDEGVHFIQKPFAVHDLAAKVREVLDSN